MPNRTICEALKELRTCHETRNYSYMIGLIEEVQSMANSMEAALYDQADFKYAKEEYKKLKKKIKKLKESNV